MGGRLDTTNVVAPVLSAITPIGYDHTAFLGDKLESIAAEKAGILKHAVPAVIGRQREVSAAVISGRMPYPPPPPNVAIRLNRGDR